MLARGFAAAVVLNSDSPTLPTAVLASAARLLLADGDRVVLGPAEDGGYYLLGMKAAYARLFGNIAWSTDTVADATRARAHAMGLEIVELPLWYDVDDEAALSRLIAELAGPAEGRGDDIQHPSRGGRYGKWVFSRLIWHPPPNEGAGLPWRGRHRPDLCGACRAGSLG